MTRPPLPPRLAARMTRRLTDPRRLRLLILAALIPAAIWLGDWIGYGTSAVTAAVIYLLLLRPEDAA